MKPNAEIIETLSNIRTEIGAGMVLFPKSEIERGFNIACERAASIIFNYQQGLGLFQLTATARTPAENPVGPANGGVSKNEKDGDK